MAPLGSPTFWLTCILLAIFPGLAIAIDLQPGELQPLRPGINVFQFSASYSERSDWYRHGRELQGSPKIESVSCLFRVGRYSEMDGHPVVLVAHVPVGYIHPGGDLSSQSGDSGVGDATFVLGVWPYANFETQAFFAIGGYLMTPTGSYDPRRAFNLGENRYRAALQAGGQAPIAAKLIWMWAVDATFFQKNTDFGPEGNELAQAPLYAGQIAIRYQFSPGLAIAGSYFHIVGGETTINNESQNNAIRTRRYLISGLIAPSPSNLFTIQYGSDLSTENGFREDRRIIVRYSTTF